MSPDSTHCPTMNSTYGDISLRLRDVRYTCQYIQTDILKDIDLHTERHVSKMNKIKDKTKSNSCLHSNHGVIFKLMMSWHHFGCFDFKNFIHKMSPKIKGLISLFRFYANPTESIKINNKSMYIFDKCIKSPKSKNALIITHADSNESPNPVVRVCFQVVWNQCHQRNFF